MNSLQRFNITIHNLLCRSYPPPHHWSISETSNDQILTMIFQFLLCARENIKVFPGQVVPSARPNRKRTLSGHSTARMPYRPFSEQSVQVQEAYRAETHMQSFQDRETHGCGSHGAWCCCWCRHENKFVHRFGDRTFGRLNCANCDRVFCSKCVETDVLSQDMVGSPPYAQGAIVVSHYEEQEVSYGVVCPACGSSRRAEALSNDELGVRFSVIQFDRLGCRCGSFSNNSWHRFSIGSPYDWLGDRTACYGRALLQLIDRTRHDVG